MLFRISFLTLLIITLCAPVSAAPDDAPAWLQQVAKIPGPSVDKSVSSIVLHDEAQVAVSPDGKIVTTTTYAVRILTREGRDAAIAEDVYFTDMGKVREIKAWMIRPSGQVKSYGKDYVIDIAGASNDVYDESRSKKIVAVDDVEPGAVFGYQTISEMRPYFNQTVWYFQSSEPVVSSRITLTLPQGWTAKGVTFNHPSIEPKVSGTSLTWELRDLPPIEIEPSSPTWTNLAPRVAISYFPADVAGPSNGNFVSWTDVSTWYSNLSDPQAQPDEAITAKARDLTRNATTEFEKLQAIARYVQGIQYISIQIGVGRWRPHSAAQVFAKSYGDCKDKANLMRAMLKVLQIESYPVLIYSGDSTFVRENWPSPRQFNHCIIAIKVSDQTLAATVIAHANLGRVLLFDATDDNTPIGDLPEHEQGSLALIAAGSSGSLERVPVIPAERNSLERQIDATIDGQGLLTATINERTTGSWAALNRTEYRNAAQANYVKMVEAWVTNGATGARVNKVTPRDDMAAGRFDLDVEFMAPSYGQLMQDRLMIFKPVIVSRRASLSLTKATRKHPVVLRSSAYSETVRVKLPAGFAVDELPDAVKLDPSFGSYVTNYEVKDDRLLFTRKLVLKAGTIPVDQYSTVRSFFEKIRAAEQAPVVLARK